MKNYSLQIPKPCHENWTDMNAVEKGRFCASCQKTVFDFSNISDAEILAKFKNSDENPNTICGRFKKSQLDRELARPCEKPFLTPYVASGLFGILTVASAQSQQKDRPETAIVKDLTDKATETESFVTGELAMVDPDFRTIKGNVADDNGPLPGASVFKNDTRVAIADVDGNYALKAQTGDLLTFSFVGLVEQKITVGSTSTYNIKLTDHQLMGEVVVTKRANFFKRIYFKIKNWFR